MPVRPVVARRESLAKTWLFVLCLIALLVLVLVIFVPVAYIVNFFITVVARRYEPYRQWDPPTFCEWKDPWVTQIGGTVTLFMAIAIYTFVYV